MWWPFAGALVAYLLFRLWYDGWRGPLTAAEIDEGLAAIAARGGSAGTDTGQFRQFLEADDGREFVMLNLVKVTPGLVPHPISGEPVEGRAMLDHYTRHFIRRLVARGGHPAIVARKVGPYVDAWGDVPADPGWSIVGFMRYRSRRDLLALAADPSFGPVHAYKSLGTRETFSFPTQPMMKLFVGPRLWVALLLALLAALASLGLK
ncbi:hypothetical protein FJQ54_07625 [Sandaracinobacter neustonicus]|uniref:DUF1330 domain-containing protein n=1 Tax=Sandaracinobacter neustonicus TaxID=1715348 RepID=A0A501XM48_9SPHN|nr:hypothetical protein [Sandaracinobacter neustonicus]TPE61762.1 hypothetical protein FJQ54_07625 [Sandaracinobacter neustonicus]